MKRNSKPHAVFMPFFGSMSLMAFTAAVLILPLNSHGQEQASGGNGEVGISTNPNIFADTTWVREHPEIRQGWFVDKDGDSTFRDSTFDLNWTYSYCFGHIDDFNRFRSNKSIGPALFVPGILAFNNDSLYRYLIDATTFGEADKDECKINALSQLDLSHLSDHLLRRIDSVAVCGLQSPVDRVRVTAAVLIANLGRIDQISPILVSSSNFNWVQLVKEKDEVVPLLSKIARDADETVYRRMSSAFAVYGINKNDELMNATVTDILNKADIHNVEPDVIRGYWLAIRRVWNLPRSENITQQITKLAYHDEPWLDDQAIIVLGRMAEKGNQAAVNSLRLILKNHPNVKMRSLAASLIP